MPLPAMTSDVWRNITDPSGTKQIPNKLPISERPPVPGAPSCSGRPREESAPDGRLRTFELNMTSRCVTGGVMGDALLKGARDCEPEGSDSVTPPYTRWAESLHALLSDSDGAALFRKFVTQENQQNTLLFYFAVEGYKKDRPPQERTELAKIIHRRFVKQSGESPVDISGESRSDVAEAIRNSTIGADLFDRAQQEVERVITKTSYPSFLKSDLYVQYVSNGGISPDSTESTGSGGSQIPHGYLPTLPEDSELDVSPKRGDAPTSSQPLPLTQESLLATQGRRSKLGKQQEGHFLRGSGRSRLSPYHPSCAAFAPAASTNDSELQSLSSDAISDDTMSLTDSSVDGYPTRKTHKKKMNQVIRNNMRQNGKLSSFPEMPAMHRPPRDHVPQSPAEFAKILIEKLKILENKQLAEEKLNAKLRKVEEEDLDMVKSAAPPLTTKETEPLIPGLLEEDPNSILDDHLHRVFDSAKQSPGGGHSPRSRSRSPDRVHHPKLSNPSLILPPSTNNGHVPQLPRSLPKGAGLPRQKSRDSGLHLTEIPVDVPPPPAAAAAVHHHYHHYKHLKTGRLPQDVAAMQQHIHYAKFYPVDGVSPYSTEKLDAPPTSSKHKSKRWGRKSDISSTTKTTDSGIYDGPPSLPSDGEVHPHKRIEDWLHHSIKGASHKKSHRSSESSQQKRASGHSSTRSSGSHERTAHLATLNYGGYVSTHRVGHQPAQPFVQDPSMPPMQPPEPRVVLEEARRRIDISSKQKSSGSSKSARVPSTSGASTLTRSVQPNRTSPTPGDDDQTSGKGKKSSSASSSSERAVEKAVTTVAYFLSPDPIPYRTTLPGKKITLRQFKTLINKRGTYSYTFKMPSEEFESGVVHQIISDEDAFLPLYEGKIVGKVEKVDCPETTM